MNKRARASVVAGVLLMVAATSGRPVRARGQDAGSRQGAAASRSRFCRMAPSCASAARRTRPGRR